MLETYTKKKEISSQQGEISSKDKSYGKTNVLLFFEINYKTAAETPSNRSGTWQEFYFSLSSRRLMRGRVKRR